MESMEKYFAAKEALWETKLELLRLEVSHLKERLENTKRMIMWGLGIVVPVITVFINTVIQEVMNK